MICSIAYWDILLNQFPHLLLMLMKNVVDLILYKNWNVLSLWEMRVTQFSRSPLMLMEDMMDLTLYEKWNVLLLSFVPLPNLSQGMIEENPFQEMIEEYHD